MAKKIATFEDLANIPGFTLQPGDDFLRCVTKGSVMARLKSNYLVGLEDYGVDQLIPISAINPFYDWSYFTVKVTLAPSTTQAVYACGRGTGSFTGSSIEDFDKWLAASSSQRLNADKYSPDGTQWNIRLREGKWVQSPYTGNGGYLYLVLQLDSTYYLYGGKSLVDITGSSGFDALDVEEYIDQMKPAYVANPNIGGYIKTLTGIAIPIESE